MVVSKLNTIFGIFRENTADIGNIGTRRIGLHCCINQNANSLIFLKENTKFTEW